MTELLHRLRTPFSRISGYCQCLRCDGAVSAMVPTLEQMRELSGMLVSGHVVPVSAFCLTALCGVLRNSLSQQDQFTYRH